MLNEQKNEAESNNNSNNKSLKNWMYTLYLYHKPAIFP